MTDPQYDTDNVHSPWMDVNGPARAYVTYWSPPVKVGVRLLDEDAIMPFKAHPSDACFDLFAHSVQVIDTNRFVVGTGVALRIPQGYAGFIEGRSGLAAKHGIAVLGGVIDAGYEGEVKVILLNTGTGDIDVQPGMKIAQIHFRPVLNVVIERVKDVAETARGEKASAAQEREDMAQSMLYDTTHGHVVIFDCYACPSLIAMSTTHFERMKETHENFYCSMGHIQHFTAKTQKERAYEERIQRLEALRQQEQRIREEAERRAADAEREKVKIERDLNTTKRTLRRAVKTSSKLVSTKRRKK